MLPHPAADENAMLTCPMCKKRLNGLEKECTKCQTDVSLLVDYVENLQEGLVRADALTKTGRAGRGRVGVSRSAGSGPG